MNLTRAAFSITAVLLVSAAAVLPQTGQAVYDRTLFWEDVNATNLETVFRSHYGSPTNLYKPNVPASVLAHALNDKDGKIPEEFKVTPEIRPLVNFWLKVYTEYTTHHVVLFDEKDPTLIYEVIDFRELSATSRNQVVYEILRERQLKRAIGEYRKAFARLSRNASPKKPTPYEQKILTAVKKSAHAKKPSYAKLSTTLKTQTGQRDNVIKGLLAAEFFFPKMEQIFESQGVPSQITRLAIVESSFNLHAVSRAGAVGVWQFLRSSALEYMQVNEVAGIDERLSPLKSTLAAAKLLKRNHKIFGNWAFAITSYNHGIRNLKRIPKAHRTVQTLVSTERPVVGWASRNYYAEFLAILHAETYRTLFYGSPPLPRNRAVAFHRVSRPVNAATFAAERGLTLQDFKTFNPDIRDLKRALPKGTLIAVPGESDSIAELISNGKTKRAISADRSRSRHRAST